MVDLIKALKEQRVSFRLQVLTSKLHWNDWIAQPG